MSSPFNTPGAFSWCELMTSDPAAATKFYKELLGWEFETMNMGMPYNVIKAGGQPIGGIAEIPEHAKGMPPSWGCYITVANADDTAAAAEKLGGKILLGPIDIPTVGRFVFIQDPQGAMFYAIAYEKPESENCGN
jgi:uncharacterized protein